MYLRAFAKRGIVLDGLQAASVSRSAVKHWRTDDWFSDLEDAAMEEAGDRIEAEVHRRAIDGVDEPIVFQGMPTMLTDKDSGEQRIFTVKKYSDKLAETLLKGHKGEKYRDKVDNKHSFEGQTGVLVVPAPIDPASWAKAAAEQQAKYAGNTGEDKKS
jgi:hypothetical protein